MKFKEVEVKYKDEGNGSIEGYASTWIREPDSYGDIVKQGAFAKSLKERWNGGKGIPFIWSHKYNELDSFIGTATANEDDTGLHFIAEFDSTPEAQRVRELYKDRRLSKFSFAYDTIQEAQITLDDKRKANELQILDIHEISAVCIPANDDAGVVDVKSGKRNSKADEDKLKSLGNALKSALDIVLELIGDTDEPDDGEDGKDGKGETEDSTSHNSEKMAELLAYINKIEEKEKKS